MAEKYVIGIDGGTQSSKVSIFDLRGNLICSEVAQLQPIQFCDQGTATHPNDDVWDSIASACRQAMKSFPYNPKDIIGAGLCTIRCCRVLLDHQGALLHPVISWMDPRLSQPYQHEDQRVGYVTTTSGYVAHRLTDEFKDTAANYEGVWPIDKHTWQWSSQQAAFNACNTPRDMLFELVSPGDLIGRVTAESSRKTGLPVGLAIFATANDKAVEALGAGLDRQATVMVSLGTYIGAMAYGDFKPGSEKHYFHNMACIPKHYLHESRGIRQGMGTVSWFCDLLGSSVLDGSCDTNATAEEQLNAEAEHIPVGCNGLITLPDWLAPNEQPFKRGAIIGFNSTHTRGHIYRSILESIAMTMKNHVDAMCADWVSPLQKVLITGGGANSDVFMQIFADVFDLPVSNNQITGAAGLGSAICAAFGSGAFNSFDEAIERMVSFDKIFTPDTQRVRRYDELNTIFNTVSKQTDVVNRQLEHSGFQL